MGRVESIVGKGENVGYQHFLLFPQCFQKVSFSGSLKVRIVWYRAKEKEKCWGYLVNSSRDDNLLDQSKLKAFADNKINVAEN